MKYESSILKRLIDTYGVIGNPRYLSEIIKEFIVRGKELYPQLFTYQSDWLAHIDEFGLTPEYTVSYTGQHIYAPNTKEKPVKSAILKGQTLVNLISDGEVTQNAKNDWVVFSADFNVNMIKTSTDYTLITYVISNSLTEGAGCAFGVSGGINDGFGFNAITVPSGQTGIYKIKLKTKNVFSQPPVLRQQIFNDVATGSITFKQILVEGDYTNQDIPYFEGMQSVKMPVLTTVGKNLFDGNLINGYYEDGTLNKIIGGNENIYKTIKLNLKKGTYTFSFEESVRFIRQVKDGVYEVLGGDFTKFTTTLNTDGIYVLSFRKTDNTDFDLTHIQVEQGSIATSYEPYKTNILTVNEDVTLRSNGNICDELNLLTGQLTQRIDEDGEVLSQEVVKTVDLTIHDKDHQKVERLTSFEGGTHFTTSSQEGSLLPTLTVDVVTDLEETLMVCSLEGNTM